jgi:sulfopyruvate decarboxylase TPP-binding subunit
MVDHPTAFLTSSPADRTGHITSPMANPSSSIDALLGTIRNVGVTHVVGIPDNTSAPLFDALMECDRPSLITVTREGEAFAIAAGLWLGGSSPLVVIQNTGLLEAGDALRGTAVRMGAPIPVIVTGRGYAKTAAAGVGLDHPLTRDVLIRPDVDSVALLTQPTLEAWGIPHRVCHSRAEASESIRNTVRAAQDQERPVALLLIGEMC